MIRKVWPLLLLLIITCSLTAQNTLTDTNALKDNPSQNDLTVFTNAEIQKLDSMLDIWYVKSGLDTKHSVLSKLKDDTTAYDNNDTLIFKRSDFLLLKLFFDAVPKDF